VDTSFGKSVSSIDFINNFKFETHSFTFELNFSMNFNEEEYTIENTRKKYYN
jgi:hypothetical protein